MQKSYPCEECKMRQKYETNPKSLAARFWHWHTRFCPGWKSYFNSLNEEEKESMIKKYDLRK